MSLLSLPALHIQRLNYPHSFSASSRFSSSVILYLAPSISPANLTSLPVPAEKRFSTARYWDDVLRANCICCVPYMACGKLQAELCMAFLQPLLFLFVIIYKVQICGVQDYNCTADKLSHLRCRSLQLLQSYNGTLFLSSE
ncbi:hypothetical protein XENOCAPTIV_016297 [Xenoophorus captivus]|uniref:Uncharacterized protein n=1 Tax=Xenoophorus captivus TaxID=1517983 RepID=A0ABV0QJC4_9TELE